jgi:hypothetical protein
MFSLFLTAFLVADGATVALPIAWIYGVGGAAVAALLVRAKAGNRIAYRVSGGSPSTQLISRAFDRLGTEIDRRISATRTD